MNYVPELIMLIGIPGVGKTRWAAGKADTHLILNGAVLNTNPKFDMAFAFALATQTPIIIDKTNGKSESRQQRVLKAKAFGYRCIGYFFDTTAEEVIKAYPDRVLKEKNFEVMVKGAARQMELPQFDEGFDELFTVMPSLKE